MPRLSKIGAAALAAFGWTGLSSVTASYLVVAGGGSGGCYYGGGGGAGGLLSGTTSLNPTLSYTVTIGAGAAAAVVTASGLAGNNGSNSQFGTLTAAVGGGAGGYVNVDAATTGGSGGGAGGSSGSVFTAKAGTSGQGNAGGTNGTISSPYPTGGGGGAGAVGSNGASSQSGAGGTGTASSISGTSVTYAGGGGGGGTPPGAAAGAGGSGGGGAGSTGSANATAGTANTGGGGGGASNNAVGTTSGAGGSGVVIISYVGAQQFGGGVVTSSGGNTIHTFTTSGTLSPLSSLTASYLIVAGGGGGSSSSGGGGGGGAGGLLSGSSLTIDTNSIYAVTVGSGGAGGLAATISDGTAGSNSSFSMVSTSAVGGGKGVAQGVGGNGGSGGGGGDGANAGALAGGTGTSGQGNNGGSSANQTGGGGGGAGAVGGNGSSSTTAGNGGAGTASSISGSSVTYAGGGGGGQNSAVGTGAGTGGTGGGGNGGRAAAGTAGTANLGAGGGGGGRQSGVQNFDGGSGGSGVVIISYAGSTQQMAGGTVTVAGGNVIHTFTSSGYLTPIVLVNNSLRFRSSASAYLNRTPTTASNRKTWTWSGWVKRGALANGVLLGTETVSAQTYCTIYYVSDKIYLDAAASNVETMRVYTNAVFRDPSAWYHVVAVLDTTQATASNRTAIYVNGVQQTLTVSTNPAQNLEPLINSTVAHNIGRNPLNGIYFDGYLAEVQFIDGQALTPNSFGTSNGLGVWQPIRYGGSYGTNGFYLPFTNPGAVTANYLVVAGGGGGGFDRGGGGGAGGLRSTVTATGGGGTLESALLLTLGQTYTITVGAGGIGETAVIANTNGSNSSISGSGITTVTSTGGGRGGGNGGTGDVNGGNGGSGGGARNNSGATGGTGTANQGFAGGSNTTNDGKAGGGGGGAGAVGKNGSPETSGRGDGGAGVATTITGSSVTYAGGGGAGGDSAFGTGGSGGGGSGASTTVNSVAGTANTGGGGGGGDTAGTYTGKAGGSGVVIISYAGTPVFTGGTITQSGGNTIHTFTSSGTLGGFNIATDYSPNGNNWTTNNISLTAGSTYDSMTDVPTLTSATAANYAVLNPLNKIYSTFTLSNGNLSWTSSTVNMGAHGTLQLPTSGKYYWEVVMTANAGGSPAIGIADGLDSLGNKGIEYRTSGNKEQNGGVSGNGASAYGATWTTNDVIGVAYDADTSSGQITFYKNNSSQGVAFSSVQTNFPNGLFPSFQNNASGTTTFEANFGQRPFAYTPPSGFVGLNTFNLPTPTIGATASTTANKYFNISLYTGNGTSQSITNSNSMQPDFIWLKCRSTNYRNQLYDSIRGATKALFSDSTDAEGTYQGVTAFNSNGFSLGTELGANASGDTFVGWQWRASNATAVTNTNGSIISTVSANTTAGFSIVTYTGNATSSSTVGHGLGTTPTFFIIKSRGVQVWNVYSLAGGITGNTILQLNSTDAAVTGSNISLTASSTTIGFGSASQVNGSGVNFVAYCFAPVAGYSAMGSYVGNDSADGTFIYTGFRPAFVLYKKANGIDGWLIYDSKRNSYNVADALLQPNTSGAEAVSAPGSIDIVSNGFKQRNANNIGNSSSFTYIYMAFAENPFKYANAR